MDLPGEIRNYIYELTILDPASHDVYNRNPPLGLLHLNAAVRREYLEFYYESHIFHLHTHPKLPGPIKRMDSMSLPPISAVDESYRHLRPIIANTTTSNHLPLFRNLEPHVLDSLRELMLHVHSNILLSAIFTPKKDNFASLLQTVSLAKNLEVLHLNSCGKYPKSLSHLIECCTPLKIFPKLLLLVIHTDRQQYTNYIGRKAYACKDLEWWKHESQSLARCKECGHAHLVEVTWRVIAKKSKTGYLSEEKQRLMKVWELLSARALNFS